MYVVYNISCWSSFWRKKKWATVANNMSWTSQKMFLAGQREEGGRYEKVYNGNSESQVFVLLFFLAAFELKQNRSLKGSMLKQRKGWSWSVDDDEVNERENKWNLTALSIEKKSFWLLFFQGYIVLGCWNIKGLCCNMDIHLEQAVY